MKVSVLLTGQLRTFEMIKYLHMNCLILPYNSDVFLGINSNNTYQNTTKNTASTTLELLNKTIDFFKPINTFTLNNIERKDYTWRGLIKPTSWTDLEME